MLSRRHERRSVRKLAVAASGAAAALVGTAQVLAATYTWLGTTGTGGTTYSTAANWTPAGPPGAADEALFSTGQANQTPTPRSARSTLVPRVGRWAAPLSR